MVVFWCSHIFLFSCPIRIGQFLDSNEKVYLVDGGCFVNTAPGLHSKKFFGILFCIFFCFSSLPTGYFLSKVTSVILRSNENRRHQIEFPSAWISSTTCYCGFIQFQLNPNKWDCRAHFSSSVSSPELPLFSQPWDKLTKTNESPMTHRQSLRK